jgi:hypothetical protein
MRFITYGLKVVCAIVVGSAIGIGIVWLGHLR